MTEVTHTTKRGAIARVMGNALALNLFFLVGIAVLATLYIGQINQAAASGFRMHELQAKMENLRIANQQLEYQAAENRAMSNVARRVSILGMVRPVETTYVSTETPSVALR